MASATSIVDKLVKCGIIRAEFSKEAVEELHRELSRRSRRVAHSLAALTSSSQMFLHSVGKLV